MANRKAIKKILGDPEKKPKEDSKKKSILSYPFGSKTEQEILKDNPERYKRIAKRTKKYVQRNLDKQQRQKDKAQEEMEKPLHSETGKKFRKFKKKVIGNIKINSQKRKAKRSNRKNGGGFKCMGVECDG